MQYRAYLKLLNLFVCFGIEQKEAVVIESVLNLKGLLTEINRGFKAGLL